MMDRSRQEVFRSSEENWYGNFKIENDKRYENTKLVCVTIHKNFTVEGGLHRVSVWGNDDLGMDYDTADYLEAVKLFNDILLLDKLTKDKLLNLGFNYF